MDEFDSVYTMDTSTLFNDHYSFDGYIRTKMSYDNNSRLWRMESLTHLGSYATTEVIPFDYPLGSRPWNVMAKNFNGILNLNLNSCDDFNSFSCMDGACITIEERYIPICIMSSQYTISSEIKQIILGLFCISVSCTQVLKSRLLFQM